MEELELDERKTKILNAIIRNYLVNRLVQEPFQSIQT